MIVKGEVRLYTPCSLELSLGSTSSVRVVLHHCDGRGASLLLQAAPHGVGTG